LVVAQSSSEIPEGLRNNPVFKEKRAFILNVMLSRTKYSRALGFWALIN
jgi:hypothetical protein